MPPRRKQVNPVDAPNIPPPAKTIEGRNDQLIAAAFDLVEKRIHNETASAQETVHFLKLGSTRARLEEEKLKAENLALEARVKEMEGRRSGEDVYQKALAAFRGYSGQEPIIDDDDDAPDYY